ncbi:tetratricopeptide repeat protein [Aquisalinus flavus]|uniref:Tetratricopeptide repeat protein n=1 Tax=Aquisalinus flavus TaxID=1526572 RepID=A0A8J2V4S2_9PROT|nr:hypothetical protein [Aquisalinus flavus]MBD0425902.1 hypothetical protein [Aquisalinus flavus]UNE48503.1 hypothetical protein FF099_10805 [Aquisalinus flavus]GGD12380.1 hypothetical protein GCM10011342_21420 [Aquisalinus flavus]
MTRIFASLLFSTALSLGPTAGALAQEADDSEAGSSLSRTEDALERILQDALEEGYVSLREDEQSAGPEQSGQQPAAANSPAAIISATDEDGYADIGAILQETGYTTNDEVPAELISATCQDNDLFAFRERVYSWEEASRMQIAIAGSAAAPDAESSIRLAKHYLALGFAEEAMSLVRPFATDERARTVLYMGETVAGRISDGNVLKSVDAACSGPARLWRAVALVEFQPSTAVFLAASVANELKQLPPHLRVDFATRLGITAAENGQWILAEKLYDIATEETLPGTTQVIYLRALINAHNGVDVDVALNTVERFAQQEGPLQAQAILMLSDLQPQQEGEHYPGYYRDLENVAVRSNGAPQSFPEAFMEVRLAAETGKYSRAVEIAAQYQYPTIADRDTMKTTLAGLFETALSRTSATTRFAALNGYIAHRPFFDGIDREAVLTIGAARAALDLGLPEQAISLMQQLPFETLGDEERKLLARAYVADRRYDEALSLTRNSEDPVMMAVAATALHRLGREREALDVLRRGPGTMRNLEGQARIAWASGQWAQARDAYAAMLVEDANSQTQARHALASYMSGQSGALAQLPTQASLQALEKLLATHPEDILILREVLTNG